MPTTGPKLSSRNSAIAGVTRSTTCGGMTTPSAAPPATSSAPAATAASTSSEHGHRLAVDHRSRVHRRDLGRERGDEGVGDAVDDDDPLGRHADLPGIHEGAEGRGLDRFVDIGVGEDEERGLAAEFEQAGLEVFGSADRDDPADGGRAGEIDPPHRWMIDECADDVARIGWRIRHQPDNAGREARIGERLDN